jgi:hypothetical protein
MPQLQQQFAQMPGGVALLQSLVDTMKNSLVYAIQGSFLLGAVLMAGACVVNFFLKEIPLRKSNAPVVQDAAQGAPAGEPGLPVAVGAMAGGDDSSRHAAL